MMTDLDAALQRLKNLPTDPRLHGMESAVLDAMTKRRTPDLGASSAVLGVAAGLALSVGFLSAAIPDRAAEAASITPFGAPPALAPSSLLGSGE